MGEESLPGHTASDSSAVLHPQTHFPSSIQAPAAPAPPGRLPAGRQSSCCPPSSYRSSSAAQTSLPVVLPKPQLPVTERRKRQRFIPLLLRSGCNLRSFTLRRVNWVCLKVWGFAIPPFLPPSFSSSLPLLINSSRHRLQTSCHSAPLAPEI